MVAITVYFEKYRPLAFGLSMSGGGVGNMAFPWITSALIQQYGWRGKYFKVRLHCVTEKAKNKERS